MRCTIVAVGRAGPGPAQALFELYAKRLTPPLALIEVEERRKLPEAQLRDREAAMLLDAVPKRATIVALDEHGLVLGSRQFAERLRAWRDAGTGDLALLIGGAAGHGGAVLDRADFTLSLGAMTWPHLLVRGMLAEQLYRGFAVLSGHPYHRN
jgi:23S rRNA (pseudouridine1915-N3)-methyltransferase